MCAINNNVFILIESKPRLRHVQEFIILRLTQPLHRCSGQVCGFSVNKQTRWSNYFQKHSVNTYGEMAAVILHFIRNRILNKFQKY